MVKSKGIAVTGGWGRDAQVPGLKSFRTGTGGTKNLLKYSHKNSKVCWVVPLLTEKSQSVLYEQGWARLHGRGWSFFGRGVWCGRNKTKLHWSEPHIVSDKDAAKRAARALPINRELSEEKRTRSGQQVVLLRALCTVAHRVSTAHRHDAVTVRHPVTAGGSLLKCRPDGGWGKRMKHLQHCVWGLKIDLRRKKSRNFWLELTCVTFRQCSFVDSTHVAQSLFICESFSLFEQIMSCVQL